MIDLGLSWKPKWSPNIVLIILGYSISSYIWGNFFHFSKPPWGQRAKWFRHSQPEGVSTNLGPTSWTRTDLEPGSTQARTRPSEKRTLRTDAKIRGFPGRQKEKYDQPKLPGETMFNETNQTIFCSSFPKLR